MKEFKVRGGRYFYKENKGCVTQPSLVVSLKMALDFIERTKWKAKPEELGRLKYVHTENGPVKSLKRNGHHSLEAGTITLRTCTALIALFATTGTPYTVPTGESALIRFPCSALHTHILYVLHLSQPLC